MKNIIWYSLAALGAGFRDVASSERLQVVENMTICGCVCNYIYAIANCMFQKQKSQQKTMNPSRMKEKAARKPDPEKVIVRCHVGAIYTCGIYVYKMWKSVQFWDHANEYKREIKLRGNVYSFRESVISAQAGEADWPKNERQLAHQASTR